MFERFFFLNFWENFFGGEKKWTRLSPQNLFPHHSIPLVSQLSEVMSSPTVVTSDYHVQDEIYRIGHDGNIVVKLSGDSQQIYVPMTPAEREARQLRPDKDDTSGLPNAVKDIVLVDSYPHSLVGKAKIGSVSIA